MESIGVTLATCHSATVEHRLVVIAILPDNVAAVAFSRKASATGGIMVTLTVQLEPASLDDAVQTKFIYTPLRR